MKLPFFKSTEEKIAEAFEAHPERQKVCFHFTDSIRDGVSFYDPDGNEIFTNRKDKGNLKKFDLYKDDRFAGRIEKVVTINFNPLSELQRYSVMVKTSRPGMMLVEGLNARPDYASWRLKYNVFVNESDEEFGRAYCFADHNYVLSFDDTVDPTELILAFMAIRIRSEEIRRNHTPINHGTKGRLLIDDIKDTIGDIKDIF